MTDADHALRERFRALAAATDAAAPPFALPVPPPRSAGGARRLGLAAALLLVAAVGTLMWRGTRPHDIPYPIDLSAVSWNAPTDFLLATPGADLLWSVPTIETGSGTASGATHPDDSTRRTRS